MPGCGAFQLTNENPELAELFEPGQEMQWSDGFAPMFQGERTFTLTPSGDDTDFSMVERFSGMMLPMIKGSLPDFGPVFDQYVADLRSACAPG